MRCSALLLGALVVITQARAQGLYSHLYEPGALRLSEIIGMEVVTPQGSRLGRISDLVFDSASGAIKEIAVGAASYPLNALLSGNEPRHVVIDPPPQSSAGATGLLPLLGRPQRAEAASYASDLGPPEAVVVDLKEGRLYLPR
jgi:sporulation protein YlmC with PRC-barrel domain